MWLQHSDDLLFCHRRALPQFLVISPPKTGSTWLADNLRRHPQLFIPAIKEVKYFSSLYKWLDLDWYASHFMPAGERIAGEASPSYAILSVEQIQAIRRLMPNVKLIFLMRDPVSRAWSHAKHTHRYREANFEESATKYEDVTETEWETNFSHDWPLTSGDYLGQLKRWSSVFPREQMYVGFYESIGTRPVEMLQEIFAFLGTDADVDLSTFPVFQRILQGPPGELSPRLEETLRRLLYARTVETVEFLHEQFGRVPPPEWQRTLTPPKEKLVDPLPEPFRTKAQDAHLLRVLAQEERFHSSYRQIYVGYRGYDIAFYRRQLIATPQTIGPDHLPPSEREAVLTRLISEGTCLIAPTLTELKEQVLNRIANEHEHRIQATTTELQAIRTELGKLSTERQPACSEFHKVHAELRTSYDELQAVRTELRALHAELQAARAELRAVYSELRANHDQTTHKIVEVSAALSELQRPSRLRLLARRVKRVGGGLMTRLRLVSS